MSRTKAPPRVKGPYSERGGTRVRIRVCDMNGHRDLYFATRKEALSKPGVGTGTVGKGNRV